MVLHHRVEEEKHSSVESTHSGLQYLQSFYGFILQVDGWMDGWSRLDSNVIKLEASQVSFPHVI